MSMSMSMSMGLGKRMLCRLCVVALGFALLLPLVAAPAQAVGAGGASGGNGNGVGHGNGNHGFGNNGNHGNGNNGNHGDGNNGNHEHVNRGNGIGQNESVLYVATNGNDAWSGTLPQPHPNGTDGPLRTIAKARDVVRTLKQTVYEPITVYIRGGTYELSDTLLFTPDDSGTETAPITYAAYPGETPVISGGSAITTTWSSYGNGIYYTDIPQAVYGGWPFRSLFVDGERAIRARYPNYVPDDDAGTGYLYAYPNAPEILAGLAQNGDFIEYSFTAPAAAAYDIWIGYATTLADNQNYLALRIDGQPVTLGAMPASGGYRTTLYAKVGSVNLTAGTHTFKLSNTSALEEHRVHMDAFVLTTNTSYQPQGEVIPPPAAGEQRVVIQAEDNSKLIDSHDSSLPFTTFIVTPSTVDRNTIVTDPSRIKSSWLNDPEALISMVPNLQYFTSFLHLDSVNETTGVIKVSGTEALDTIIPGSYFFVTGVFEELDAEGEWYLDSSAGRLYYKPVGGKNPALSTFAAPRLDRLIELEGDATGTDRVEWITFSGLTFRHSADHLNQTALRTPTDSAIRLNSTRHITIENCHFTNIDGFGVWLHLDSRNNVITGNTIENMGAGGVLFTSAVLGYGGAGNILDSRPEVQEYAPLQNEVTRNVIRNGNQVRTTGAGVLLDSRPDSTALEPGNLIAYNEFENLRRQGIFGFRNQAGHIIAYNRFKDVVTSTADAGAINLATMNNVQAPSIIKNNVIDGAIGKYRKREGDYRKYGFGIYADWESSHFHITNNTVSNTGEGSFLNKGQFNVITNNIFANDDKRNVYYLSDNQILLQNHFHHNIVAQLNKPGFSWEFINVANNLLSNHSDMIMQSDNNLYWNDGEAIKLQPFGYLGDWQTAGQDVHSVVYDPLFTDPANGDYSLQAGSPAYGIGFVDIDTVNVGVNAQADEALDLAGLAPAYTRVTAATYGRTANYAPTIPENGLYMVYAERASQQTPVPPLAITVNHANGISNSVWNEWLTPGSKQNVNYPVYMGTYEFKTGEANTVSFKDNGTVGTPDFPVALKFVRYKEMNEQVRYIREAQLSALQVKLDIGSTQQLHIQGFMDDYTKADLNRATIQYVSDNPSVATVSASGAVYAVQTGVTRIRANVTLDGVTVKTLPLKLQVGDVPESIFVVADRGLLETGNTVQLAVYGKMENGSTILLSSGLTYTSSNPSVASVNGSGLVTAVSTGSASITANWTAGNLTSAPIVFRVVNAGQAEPLLHYTFDEAASGTTAALDSGTGTAANGTFFGSATRTTDTPGGYSQAALNLNFATAGYVSPGLPASNKVDNRTEFTIALWLKLNNAPDLFDRIVSKGSAIDWVMNGGTTSALKSYITLHGNNFFLPDMNVGTGWNFFVITYDGAKLQMYRGDTVTAPSLVASFNTTGAAAAPTHELRIGSTSLTTANRTPPAYIDDFRFYGVAYPASDLDRIRRDNLPH